MAYPTRIGEIIGQTPGKLHALIGRVNVMGELIRLIHRLLPSPLDRHCPIAGIEGQRLVLFTDSPAWATRLRYHAPALLRRLQAQSETRSLIAVDIRVGSWLQGPPDPPPGDGRMGLSESAAACLRDMAAVTEAPELRNALYRLARRGTTRATARRPDRPHDRSANLSAPEGET